MMQHETFKNRKERLAELIAKNKIRLARNATKEWYQDAWGYHLTDEQFLEFDASQRTLAEVYRKVRALQIKKGCVFTHFRDIFKLVNRLKQQERNLDEVNAIFYYVYAKEAGGIKIKFKEFWDLLQKIGDNPMSDIMVIDENLTFGICVEVEEYDYSFTVWGFDSAL